MERFGDMKNQEGYYDPTAGSVLRKEGITKQVRRGEIYYISIPHSTGHEMQKDRPGIIVSCDELNRTSPCVIVVFCTAVAKKDLPEHVTIRSTPNQSTAMCEHICTVDKSRIGKLVGRCTGTEMERVTMGIALGMDMGYMSLASPEEEHTEPVPEPIDQSDQMPSLELARAEAERDTYKSLYEKLLDSMTMERRVTA